VAKHKFIRDSDSIDGIRSACQVAATVLKKMKDAVYVGMTTAELDEIGREWIEKLGAESACHQYQAGEHTFPAHTCLSINEEVVHGIGKSHRKVEPSDVVSIDVVVRYNGYIGDNATTIAIAPVKPADQALLPSLVIVWEISQMRWSGMCAVITMELYATSSGMVSD
jgi:methionyl aminopeptidase